MPCDVQDLAESINKRLDFQVRMLRNLHLRAQSNKERVQNENVYVRHGYFFFKDDVTNVLSGFQHGHTA